MAQELSESPAEPAQQGDAFAQLEAQAKALEGAAAPVVGQAPAAAVDTTDAELLAALTMARVMVAPMFDWWPDFGRVWSDQALQRIAGAGAEVMRRHGLTMAGVMGQWGPYIGLAVATAPPAFVTYKAIQDRREAQQRERAQPPKD